MQFLKTQSTNLYSTAQIREIDRLMMQELGLAPYDLMVRAGKAAWDYVKSIYTPSHIIIFCGTGNNGGDGYILGLEALKNNCQVTCYSLASPKSPLAKQAHDAFIGQGGSVTELSLPILANLNPSKFRADVLIDALLGTGAKGELRINCQKVVELINCSHIPVIALDIPTGVDADTGMYLSPKLLDEKSMCVKADKTITFAALKQGFYTGEAMDKIGHLHFARIGVPDKVYEIEPCYNFLIRETDFYPLLPQRLKNTHKGSFGAVTIAGGIGAMSGAPSLAAKAALRAGAGWVSSLVESENKAICASFLPDIICGAFENEDIFNHLCEHANVLVVGPGLGQSDKSYKLLIKLLKKGSECLETKKNFRVLLDADALNMLPKLISEHPDILKPFKDKLVMTPHPKEAARLLGVTVSEVQANRFKASKKLNALYDGVIILKGAGTLITDNARTYVCPYGNPNMSVAGMGDVLSGVLGALMAQTNPEFSTIECAIKGVLIHSLAGDLASVTYGAGLMASDVCESICQILGKKAEITKSN